MCLPQFQNELNIRMYSSTRFIFYDSSSTQSRSDKAYGYETAAKFFIRIGPQNLGYIKQVYCHFHWIESSMTLPHLFKMLSLMASTDPPRKIKNLHLHFTKMMCVVPFQGARTIRRRCFALHGFPGLEIILIFPNSKDQVTEADLNAGIVKLRDPGPSVNFLKILPAELRNRIFQYLIPRVCKFDPFWSRFSVNMPGWLVVNRQMNAEVCWLLYLECEFKLCIRSMPSEGHPQDPTRTFCTFLERIGRQKASQIRSITICLGMYEDFWAPARGRDIPSIAGFLRKINQNCAFQIDASFIPDPFIYEESEYQFRIPTRVGKTLIVKIWLPGSVPSLPEPHKTLDGWLASLLKTSCIGF